jgi:uncharacterized RDD family membrane protein YckC
VDQVDNRLAVETPEGVEFELDLAGVMPRAGAFLIDLSIRGVVFSVLGVAAAFLGQVGQGLYLIAAFLILWAYMPLFELLWAGQTPGKRAFGIRVVNRDGTHVGWYGSIVRNLLRVVDSLPVGYAVAAYSMVLSGRFQRLGDLAGDTVVVYVRSSLTADEERPLPPVEPVQLSLVLTTEEQQAVVAFAERYRQLGPDRSAELASLVMPQIGLADPREATRTLYGAAQRIVRWG